MNLKPPYRYVVTLSIIGIIVVVLQVILSVQARADQEKESDLQILSSKITNYAYDYRKLPESLNELKNLCDKSTYYDYNYRVRPNGASYSDGALEGRNNPDTTSGTIAADKCVASRLKNYEYKKIDARKYELCTTFSRNTNARNLDPYTKSQNLDYDSYQSFSQHDSGKYCFKLMARYSYYNDPYNDGTSDLPTPSATPKPTATPKPSPTASPSTAPQS